MNATDDRCGAESSELISGSLKNEWNEAMNGKMFFGWLWMAFAALALSLPDLSKVAYEILFGNIVIGLLLMFWGIVSKR
jgi:hypothetical protein